MDRWNDLAKNLPLGLAALLLALAAWPANAQSTYVSAALVGDVLRTTHSESALGSDLPGGEETIGFALRVGTPLGSRWGVELEFTRAGEIETDFSGVIPLASRTDLIVSPTTPIIGPTLPQIFPSPLPYRLRSTQRYTTLSTTLWIDQDLSDRISLVYLAGMGFHRTTFESESRFDFLPAGITLPTIFAPLTKTVTYGVRPLVGFEACIGLTEHVNLVPGVRLHGLENGWLLRPAVGLEWEF
jgi:hypothetical protein